MTEFRLLGSSPELEKNWRIEKALYSPIGFVARNIGPVLLEDLRVMAVIPKAEGLLVSDELPERPGSVLAISSRASAPVSRTRVRDCGDHWEVQSRVGKVQPNAETWGDPFFVGSANRQSMNFNARVFADNISDETSFSLGLEIKVSRRSLKTEEDE